METEHVTLVSTELSSIKHLPSACSVPDPGVNSRNSVMSRHACPRRGYRQGGEGNTGHFSEMQQSHSIETAREGTPGSPS